MKLYILVQDCGDGSSILSFTTDTKLINKLQEAYDDGTMDYENGIGVDGDGFSYTTLNVPDDSTPESLGIYSFIQEDDFDFLTQET